MLERPEHEELKMMIDNELIFWLIKEINGYEEWSGFHFMEYICLNPSHYKKTSYIDTEKASNNVIKFNQYFIQR